jgi:hypothetical protein
LNVGVKESQASSDATKSNPESITALPSAICDPLGADEKLRPLRVAGRSVSSILQEIYSPWACAAAGGRMPCGYFDGVGDMSL